MNILALFITLVIATEHKTENNKFEPNAYSPTLVKIEEDEFAKVKKTSKYFGVYYNESQDTWQAQRRSKNEKKAVYNGYYKDEETAAHASDNLARQLMENGENHKLNFPDDESEVHPEKKAAMSNFIGVCYCGIRVNLGWRAQRYIKSTKKMVYNGYYKDKETAAHASDTLARQLMTNGEQNYKLNFPHDETEVYPNKTPSSVYIGVTYDKQYSKWIAQRWSKNGMVRNGRYTDEEAAAHASDNLARQLMQNGEQNLKLNFPDDENEVYPKKKTATSVYIGVCYDKQYSKWRAQRWSKNRKKMVQNGRYTDEETAAHASDTLTRKLMANDEQKLKLNFPDDDNEVRKRKRKRHNDFGRSRKDGAFKKFE